jgi:hypothetical protein
MDLLKYEYTACRDLRHSWRADVKYVVYPVPEAPPRGLPRSATHVLMRTVTCSSCETLRTEQYALRVTKDRDAYSIIGRISGNRYGYPKDYVLHGDDRPSSKLDFTAASFHRALVSNRVHVLTHKE